MFHVFVDFMRALACLMFAVSQGFAITLDVVVLGTEFTVLLAALHVSLAFHAFRTFVVVITVVIFGMRRHGLRKRNGTGQRKQRRKQGVFVLYGVAPLELSCVPTR